MINKEITGDILEMFENKEFDVIVQGCNCFNIMDVGLAAQIAFHYPKPREVDLNTNLGDVTKMGTYSQVKIGRKGIIINGYTQYYGGSSFEYQALINLLAKLSEDFKDKHIGFPEIGCGANGGDWSIVRKLIDDLTPDLKITVVHYDNGIKTVGKILKNDSETEELGEVKINPVSEA